MLATRDDLAGPPFFVVNEDADDEVRVMGRWHLRWLALGVFILFWALQGPSWAQLPSDAPPEKVGQLLELIDDPEVKRWLEGRTQAAPAQPDASLAAAIADWEEGIRARIGTLAAAFLRMPRELSSAAGTISRDVNSGRPGLVVGILALLIAIGVGVEWLIRGWLARARRFGARTDAGQMAVFDAVALLAFSTASVCAFLAFDWPPLLRKVVLVALFAVIAFRLALTIARLFLRMAVAPGDRTVDPVEHAEDGPAFRYWMARFGLISGFLLFGWALTSLMPAIGFSVEFAQLAALALGLGILAIAIEVVWRRPGDPGSLARRMLLTLFLIALWGTWVAGLLGFLWLGIFALLLPSAVRGAGAAAQTVAQRSARTGAFGVVANVLIVRGVRAIVIALAVAWLAYVWRIREASLEDSAAAGGLVNGLLSGVVVLLVADLLWQISKALIEYQINRAPAQGSGPDELGRAARLRTLLPIFRNALAVFIGVVAVLTILGGLGVQILPLIAGAGIFGVAIGFGSQTLVKDILSGVFYMMDDAFRVGEYIQSGSYKGTVESFSLRSVRLRHHRGAVFTVPFGTLGAVQNASRDWVVEKMTINITYDSDVDLARRLIKKIGKDLAADPEFADATLQPLKMQGIDSFGDFAVVLRLKLMTRPGAQFAIKRKALFMIKVAFDENGVKIAVPTVHVEGGSDSAAAAETALKRIEDKKGNEA